MDINDFIVSRKQRIDELKAQRQGIVARLQKNDSQIQALASLGEELRISLTGTNARIDEIEKEISVLSPAEEVAEEIKKGK